MDKKICAANPHELTILFLFTELLFNAPVCPSYVHVSMRTNHEITMVFSFFFFFFFIIYNPSAVVSHNMVTPSTDGSKFETYIVHVRPVDNVIMSNFGDLESWYRSFFPKAIANSDESPLVYSYNEVFSGFAARLTEDEVKEMAKKEGFVRAYPNRILPLLTTHTPDFLGLQVGNGLWRSSNLGKGVIIGVLDSGILPSHPSFNDEGVPPPPAEWKGDCEFDKGCNNKIIGARTFNSGARGNKEDNRAPFDDQGHGTHTASTAAGNFVKNVTSFGLGNGTASGMAPHAHLAIYKVCNLNGCPTADVLAGLDAAVADGVHVLSLSLGGLSIPFDSDPIAIGSFAATERGIVVVGSAGNNGPKAKTLSNEAPWMVTVSASTLDRSFMSTVNLGNGKQIEGQTLFQPVIFASKFFPLVYPGDITCSQSDFTDIEGKIIACTLEFDESASDTSAYIKEAGGVGAVLVNDELTASTIMVENHILPASQIPNTERSTILSYVNSTKNPTASITFNGTILGTYPARVVAAFSSRGPNRQSPSILKPDISAPGVNIIAGWNTKNDSKSLFNIISGTSMATPHISGIAALIKSAHPDWSPAAIKSAMMTTADALDSDGKHIKDERNQNASFFSMGVGHVNPTKADEAGLVFDIDSNDYVGFLCGLGLGDSGVGAIVRRSNASCSGVKNITQLELNYPAIVVPLKMGSITVNRTVTNVGKSDDKYTVEMDAIKGASVTVEPKTLSFTKVNEKKSFSVTLDFHGEEVLVEANLKWVSGKKVVRIPIVIGNIGN